MKNIVFILLVIFTITSCKEDSAKTNDNAEENTELVELRNKVAQLELDNEQKDSVINETISFFNEVQDNLLKIGIKQDEIRIKSNDPELTQEDQEWILSEIQKINHLRNQNAKTVASLKKQISDKDIKISEFSEMMNQLVVQIKAKDQQILILQKSLMDRDMEYAALFDEYQEQVELALDVMKELNTVYYAYGTKKELIDNDIIVTEGGFIGIGRQTNLSDDFNSTYFETLDKTKVKEISVVGKKPKIITDHPLSSYKWDNNKLIILDADRFWKVSKFLIVEVK